MTNEQSETYVKKHGAVCPFCQSWDISGSSIDASDGEMWQDIQCGECNKEWRDVYKLSYAVELGSDGEEISAA